MSTPPDVRGSSDSGHVQPVPRQPTNPPSKERSFFIEPPKLSASQRLQYKPLKEISLAERRVNEVIGEYREGINLYYFAREDGGIAYRFPANPFTKKYPELVATYGVKKSQHELAPFDPSANYVHPLSRIKLRRDVNNDVEPIIISDDEEIVPDSDELDEDENDQSEDDDEYDGPKSRRQPERGGNLKVKKDLPFSPRKSRSRKVLTIVESESDNEETEGEESRPRRSGRARKSVKIILDDDDYLDEDDDPEQGWETDRKSTKKTKTSRIKTTPASYGHVRNVTALGGDPFSDDEENETLRRHRDICEKCHQRPAHLLIASFRKKTKGKGKKRKRSTDDEFEESDSEQRLVDLGGWVRCLKCPVSAHWSCLARTQQDEILKAIRENDHKIWASQQSDSISQPPRKRSNLDTEQTTEFICGSCTRGGICMGCMETALEPDLVGPEATKNAETSGDKDIIMHEATSRVTAADKPARELLFRCFTCKRIAHYRHLVIPPALDSDAGVPEVADYYQRTKSWLCADCASYRYGLDKIVAWRPYPTSAAESAIESPNYKAQLPREYLVKWSGRSYRRLQWVPHMWLVSTHPAKLKNFISGGTKVVLLKEPINPGQDAMNVDVAEPMFEKDSARAVSVKPGRSAINSALSPLPDAELRIPLPWQTIDRVLDVVLWLPSQQNKPTRKKGKKRIIASDNEGDDDDNERKEISDLIFEGGEEPPADHAATITEWETSVGHKLESSDIDQVIWGFIKWQELGYDEASWDAPPRFGEAGYDAFKAAFEKFLYSRTVTIAKHDKPYWKVFDDRATDGSRALRIKDASKLDLGQQPNLKLMPFQVDGFNWLCNNWWNHQHCILADEMGLGKTVQITTFLGQLAKICAAFPSLVVVPNSTLTNWVREFERWAPNLRVVPFYGEKNARDVIKQFELYHQTPPKGCTSAKFHVLVTTYETLTVGKEFSTVFKNQPRWEVLVVDEGQRLKSDSSLLFKKLNELNSIHRIIMTGTPLNNNIRELFNLMNFLDPGEWKNLEALEKQYEVLDEELVKQLHNRLRPYFLRRIKSEVLQLPPKNEVIVPVSMAPLQKEVYRSILSHNVDILNGLTPSGIHNAPTKGRLNNVLMQLRKCLQHPYLYAEDIEPRDLAPQETHDKLIDASTKLRLLKVLLPKLRERGHRVLLFSQFVIALNVVEDFLNGEGYKYLRLDGSTKNRDRQKAMDDYNKPDSEYFIFLLTTRAGGVGINLFTADTVIIFDPDFNPHQDLQAIARAYRYGQQKTCLVFKLMVKDSAEERIMQIGKKKLVLDHLIVQKMDDDDEGGGENVQSILTYGAQALFDSKQGSRDIVYSDQDIDKLIDKTEKEAVQEGPKAAGGLSFSFAKVWAADKDTLEEVVEDDQADSWAQALQKINEERLKTQEHTNVVSGRGARRRAADIAKTKMQADVSMQDVTLDKGKQKSKLITSDGSAYDISDKDTSDSDDSAMVDGDFSLPTHKSRQSQANYTPQDLIDCGLCGQQHASGACHMVDKSENLAEYREMLILHADDEPWEERSAAIRAIDEMLHKRGHLALIAGQPLHPLPKAMPAAAPKVQKMKNGTSQPAHPSSSSNVQAAGQRAESSTMKAKPAQCSLCGQAYHAIKDCSIVIAGPKSISAQIQLREGRGDAVSVQIVQILRNLLAKYKAREVASA